MMKLENLNITFNRGTPIENKVLRGLSLDIQQGEFVTVIGSNGAGKSTLLNAICGDYALDSGKVYLNNKNVTKKTTWQRASYVARVFQDPMLGTCEKLTIEENMALAFNRGKKRKLSKFSKKATKELFKQKLSMLNLGLENRLTDSIGLLSGGQRQAISLLMASLQSSDILLLDEHTAALDPKTAEFVIGLTNQIIQENQLTTLMITHSMRQALDHGNRTIMLHQGKIILDISGEQRNKLDVPDLLKLFEKKQSDQITDDSLLLG